MVLHMITQQMNDIYSQCSRLSGSCSLQIPYPIGEQGSDLEWGWKRGGEEWKEGEEGLRLNSHPMIDGPTWRWGDE
jgi:hypothetical protein